MLIRQKTWFESMLGYLIRLKYDKVIMSDICFTTIINSII